MPVAEETSRASVLYTASGALLLLAGLGAGYVTYTRYIASQAPVLVAPAITAPLFVEEREDVSGTGTTLMRAIEQSATRPLSANAARLLNLDSAAGESVFTALELPAPGILLRNTRAEGSMAGIINTGAKQSPFFIISVTSYGETFSGMLAWEARMVGDLEALYPLEAAVLATTTATTTPAAPAGAFRDQVIANHDARVYSDASGRTLVYGYWNPQTLIIARDAEAFAALLARLATSRTEQ